MPSKFDDVDIRLRLENEAISLTGLPVEQVTTLSNRALILVLQGGWWENSETRRTRGTRSVQRESDQLKEKR